ncbi:hypothetical protein [Rhizobium giardinii]|uniref:hypothetical protein n=1 Tax=Rhizobium giardinii TaxID=56731 RepID=UPI003D6FB80B
MMFKLFDKKHNGPDSRILRLLEIFEQLSADITELYSTLEPCNPNPVELRFFAMSSVSVCVQGYGELPEGEMQTIINTFIEQAIALLISKMPRADYSLLHNAFIDRFGDYCDLIVNVLNAETTKECQNATFALMTTMDAHMRVERGAFLAATTGLGLVPILREHSINVRKVFVG